MRLTMAAPFTKTCVGPIVLAASISLRAFCAENPAALQSEVAAAPKSAPQVVVRALQAAGDAAPAQAGVITAAAIAGLGPAPSSAQVARVVNAAVRALPDSAIEIVRAAVATAPAEAADEIVAAALTALPDPWKQVFYTRVSAPIRTGERDFKGEPDFKGGPGAVTGLPGGGVQGAPMTMAEAVVQAALDARSGLSAPALFAVAEAILRSSPGWLIGAIYDPKGISGVGDAGLNNYANEPFRTPPLLAPEPPPTPPLVLPLPQPVSP